MEKRSLRIVFMGTPDFAVPSLKVLNEHFNVVGVITAPDRKAGRGQKLSESAVKKYAVENNLKVLQPLNLKDPEFHLELKSLDPNLMVVVAFRMLPEIVWKMPEYGTINLHGSLLPQYRGAAPINWAVINGETKTGVTTFFIEEKIDTGNVIQQREIPINPDETAGELHDKMMEIGAEVILKTIKSIESNEVVAHSQTEMFNSIKELKPAPKIFKDTCEINWNTGVSEVHNKIRGLSPYPTAWAIINDISFKFFKGKKTTNISRGAGKVRISDQGDLYISCSDFEYQILEIQMPGKKRMSTSDFLRGNADEIL